MCIVNDWCREYANLYPKKAVSIGHPLSMIFLLVGTVFFFTLQVFYVAPDVHDGFMYKFFVISAIFTTYNILGNLLACYRTSSAVKCLPQERQIPKPGMEHLWHYCDICRKLMPPRSWHCPLCKCCILKRDHHCIFAATCIGHNNHRYFFWFTFYLAFGIFMSMATLFCDVGRSVYLLHRMKTGFGSTVKSLSYFRRHHDLGFRKNCQLIMGQRGLWTFISPSLKSPLLHDGTHWQIKQCF
ncbi:probable palmitoyltransferase ZDHHC24 [Drosophila mauritiana]|uniref:Palmitoyltransferase n=1 Tax=Drosophila mauritiana TaxID=7226 RepID=A0A6P8KFX1_DROMA|nr:probable palmitoyltransferase ZDHHC24 [Drosophila mauritiana]